MGVTSVGRQSQATSHAAEGERDVHQTLPWLLREIEQSLYRYLQAGFLAHLAHQRIH